MKDKKLSFMEKNYLINNKVLKNIKNLDITLNEFLLILFFINENNRLDIDSVKKTFSFSDEEIMELFTSLIKKGLIETKVEKINGIMDEKIMLDSFYNKLILSTENNTLKNIQNNDIFSVFENAFGRTLNYYECDAIQKWLDSNISEELITSALKEATLNNAISIRYIDKILFDWTKKGIKKTDEEEYTPLFDYDWVNENNEE